jgi:hypothetical protein
MNSFADVPAFKDFEIAKKLKQEKEEAEKQLEKKSQGSDDEDDKTDFYQLIMGFK